MSKQSNDERGKSLDSLAQAFVTMANGHLDDAKQWLAAYVGDQATLAEVGAAIDVAIDAAQASYIFLEIPPRGMPIPTTLG